MPSKRTVPRTCKQCSTAFLARTDTVKRGGGVYYSRDCQKLGQRETSSGKSEQEKAIEKAHYDELRLKILARIEDERKSQTHGKRVPELLPAEAAYIAGFTDGEGTIVICKDAKQGTARSDRSLPRANTLYSLVVRIANTDRPALEWIAERIGAWITEVKTLPSRRRNYKLSIKGNQAKRLLEQLMPYLIVKRHQAEVAIEFQEKQSSHKNRYGPGGNGPIPRTPEETGYKEHYFKLLQELKKPIAL